MKQLLWGIFLSLSLPLSAQTNIEDLVREGIQLYDNGDYNKAIEVYKKALELEPKSTLANYELALTYFTTGDYPKAIEHSDIVLKQKSDYIIQAYITKGSALDQLGKTKESIKLFEKAIKQTEGHYLLYYNLALNFYKIKDFEQAEENVIKAIETNANHSSSHFLLANIHYEKDNTVQALLSTHYFLFLEPNSSRSKIAFDMLQEKFKGNVSKDAKNPNEISISLLLDDDGEFAAAELMISMFQVSKLSDENKEKSEDDLFVENTKSFFKVLGELKKDDKKGFWWDFYIPFYDNLAKSKHIETYCKYITQSGNANSEKWLNEHETQLMDFDKWLKEN